MAATPDIRQSVTRAVMKACTPFHRWLLRVGKGRIGQSWSSTRQPLLLLTTTGRRSGEPRTGVVGYLEEGDALVLAASKAGLPEHPAWYHNIVANPDVSIERDGTTQRMRARVTVGDERARLWERICAGYPIFVSYQAGITRQIPVVVLDPAE